MIIYATGGYVHTLLQKVAVAHFVCWSVDGNLCAYGVICHLITRNKGAQMRRSGVCWHGAAKKTKTKKTFEGSLPINHID